MTDFRALCVELTDALDKLNCSFNVPNQSALVERASAALAEPEPEPPTDEEILQLSVDCDVTYSLTEGVFCTPWVDGFNIRKEVVSFAWALLTRWGK